jgi:hypothetical protein
LSRLCSRIGYFSSVGSSICQGCPQNTFSRQGSIICTTCPAGFTSPTNSKVCKYENDVHPYAPNSNVFSKIFFIEKAIGYAIEFDPRSRTEGGAADFLHVLDGNGIIKFSRTGENWAPGFLFSTSGVQFHLTADSDTQDWGFAASLVAWEINPQNTSIPTLRPSPKPTGNPTVKPTSPTPKPSSEPTLVPTYSAAPTPIPSMPHPLSQPTYKPTSASPSSIPTSSLPSFCPSSSLPTAYPTSSIPTSSLPTYCPSSSNPSSIPTSSPSCTLGESHAGIAGGHCEPCKPGYFSNRDTNNYCTAYLALSGHTSLIHSLRSV